MTDLTSVLTLVTFSMASSWCWEERDRVTCTPLCLEKIPMFSRFFFSFSKRGNRDRLKMVRSLPPWEGHPHLFWQQHDLVELLNLSWHHLSWSNPWSYTQWPQQKVTAIRFKNENIFPHQIQDLQDAKYSSSGSIACSPTLAADGSQWPPKIQIPMTRPW